MRKAVEFLMDVTLLLVFILISSNYIDTLPRYTVKPREVETKLVKNTDATLDNIANTKVIAAEKGTFLMK
ncbi:MAG: hypothetical protein WCK18_09770 [Prolixibacteraceae bacterium]